MIVNFKRNFIGCFILFLSNFIIFAVVFIISIFSFILELHHPHRHIWYRPNKFQTSSKPCKSSRHAIACIRHAAYKPHVSRAFFLLFCIKKSAVLSFQLNKISAKNSLSIESSKLYELRDNVYKTKKKVKWIMDRD